MAKKKSNTPTASSSRAGRTERKEALRHKILMAAWQLIEDGRPASELGLREVARAAEIAPPSIYNHFSDMDDLGFALLDDCLLRMRRLARQTRQKIDAKGIEHAMTDMSSLLLDNMEEYDTVLRTMIQHWFNPNLEFRRTIRREMASMRADMSESMEEAAKKEKVASGRNLYNEADAIFSLWIAFIINSMDLGREKRKERIKLLERQILMLLLGSQTLANLEQPNK